MIAAPAQTYVDAIRSLPPGSTLTLDHISWEEYEELLEELGNKYTARISYNHGHLEATMPLPIHELFRTLLSDMLRILSEELNVDVQNLGSTTFKFAGWLQGLEPDGCFYIQNIDSIVGVRRFNPNQPPPPPDIAIEIDITSESLRRFPIYERLGVPELWRCDGEQFEFYELTDAGYREVVTSQAFPFLTGDVLMQFLQRGETERQSPLLRSFREWVQAHKS